MPLLHHAVLRLGEACGTVVVVLSPGAEEPSLPVGVPARIARDPTEGEGPLAGLHVGLGAVRTELSLVAGGDMPDLRAPVLFEMLRIAAEAQVDAVGLQDGEGYRPLPCVLHTATALDTAHALLHAGHRRLQDLLGALRVAIVDESTWRALDPDGRTLFDVDVPGDLEG